jgi:NAD(P)H dehydrogenase (quinone)
VLCVVTQAKHHPGDAYMGRILITAATGRTGKATAKLLLERGLAVRALVRKKDERSEELARLGAEIVTADLHDFDSIRVAMKGVSRAYFVYPIAPGLIEATTYFAQSAVDAGIEVIVNMSQISAREDSRSHVAQNHWIAERLLDRTGIAVTHLRPTFFAEWFLHYPAMIKSGVIRFPFRKGRHAPIAVSDQARVIAAILQNPEPHKSMIYQLFGAQEMDHFEIARHIGIALGKPMRYEPVTFEEFTQAATNRLGGSEERTQHLREVAIDYENGIFAGMNHVVREVGGQPPADMETFMRAHRSLFE